MADRLGPYMALTQSPFSGRILNLSALIIVLLLGLLLLVGVKESARFNNVMVGIKLLVIFLFILRFYPARI